MDELLDAFPTLGSVRERLSRMACETEPGELKTLLNDAEAELFSQRRKIAELKNISDSLWAGLWQVCWEQAHDISENDKDSWVRERVLHYLNAEKNNER